MMKSIHIDMDHTICDFQKAHDEAIISNPGILFPQSQYGFFTHLQPIPFAKLYVDLLRLEFDVHIVTRPSIRNPLSWTEKAVWIERHFGEDMLYNLTQTSHKHKFEGDYLIDDTLWPGFKGEQIQFGVAPFENWASVYNYIMTKEGKIN